MDWHDAQAKIRGSVNLDTDLNTPRSTFRYVVSTDVPIESRRYEYKNESGFIVAIGKNDKIGLPWSMLKDCFVQLQSSQGYDGTYFREFYPLQAQDHPCHVHVVGRIFVTAGIAYLDGSKYRMVKN